MLKRKILLYVLPPLATGIIAGISALALNPNIGESIGESIYAKNFDLQSYSYAVAKAAPSVVNIYVQRLNNDYSSGKRDIKSIVTSASGVVISSDGYIVTNYHVIPSVNEPNTAIWVQAQDGQTFQAFVIGYDRRTDIAVLKIDATNLQAISINLNEVPQVGDVVLAIGNPNNLGQTVTHGIISATARTGSGLLTREQMDIREGLQDLIQTDAPINKGNSGGALVNTRGNLVGVNTASFNDDVTGIYGIGFSVPTKLVVYVVNEIIKQGRVIRGYLGISDDGTHNLPNKIVGVKIGYIDPLGPAANSDLQVGDIIIGVNGKKIINLRSLIDIISSTPPNTALDLKLVRVDKNDDKKISKPFYVSITVVEDKANID